MSGSGGSAVLLGGWAAVATGIFGGCCTNVLALEQLVREVPRSGNLITFAQFAFITLAGLPGHLHMPAGARVPRLRARRVPVRSWAVMVALYFCVSVANNLALGYQISIPLHIVFRSSGLIASMACGLAVGKRYPVAQVAAVAMVSAGVVVATLASVGGGTAAAGGAWAGGSAVGVALLSLGVVLAALLGLYQEHTYRRYGKHWREGLFYNHALALPMFAVFWPDICAQARALSQSAPAPAWLGAVPSLWVALALNVVSQLACASGVHRMTSMSSSLTLNVVLNVRKLVSLVISVVLFRNPVTPAMVFGCALVFLGSFVYARTPRHPPPADAAKKES
ncbi:golgi uridine diphosphate-N- acetylglucosamine transporter [Coemansia helicoidea]|uniref:Golgi uridine diphosphate-N- acetylglucosamine transporter n=1 Tax=Coemansia helicoidea TaxID=1286919 RepID=A0ACC1KHJ6_9FUNG|nr:golgi uridine diphosphate-N- acetylglucosamine transporter [Coemansia helicoidea]